MMAATGTAVLVALIPETARDADFAKPPETG